MGNNQIFLGQRIKEIRKKRQISQEALAEKIGISPKHLSKIEVGNSFPSLQTLEKISEILDCELKDFFDFDAYKNEDMSSNSLSKIYNNLDKEKQLLAIRIIKTIGK